MQDLPGPLILFGSGETSFNGRKVFDWLFQRTPTPTRLAILETPAGFEPNSALVAGRIATFLHHHLQNYPLEITVVPARRRGTPFSPDDPALAEPVLAADCVFVGPGSPTYAARQLRESIVWDAVRARLADGAALVLASAAILAISSVTLPVYEIYKAGADLGWDRGLDLLGTPGCPLVFVPHWNNREGGANLDTSRCFMGAERFDQLRALLPVPATVVGIDEQTALILEPATNTGCVMGRDGVTVERQGQAIYYRSGSTFSLDGLAPFDWEAIAHALPPALRRAARDQQPSQERATLASSALPPEVLALVARREAARRERDWATADALRAELARLGYQMQDTPGGPHVQARKPAGPERPE
jgi:cyanophycinase-like exopeptidase